LSYSILIPCPGTAEDGYACTGEFKFTTLERWRERGRAIIQCHECAGEQSVAALLTGFPHPHTPLIEVLAEQHREEMNAIRDMGTHVSEIASTVRLVLRVVTTEVADCPCLFTLDEVNPSRLTARTGTHDHLRLTLWCEHPDHWHPWEPATYDLKRPKQWLMSVIPYLRVVVNTLRLVVPVYGAVPGLFLSEHDLKAVAPKLTFMEKLVAAIPKVDPQLDPSIPGIGQLSRAEGAALRTLRALLLEEDKSRFFGDLRRQRTSDGTFVWICPDHHSQYDPGLPESL
jgi:hypothetical protein